MSSRKDVLKKFQIVTTSVGDMSQATVTSSVVKIAYLDNIGIQCNIATGTANGTFAVQVSIDHDEDPQGTVITAGNWVTLSGVTQTITSGAPAQTIFDLNQLSAPYLRLLYTKTSGTGTFEAFASGKMV